MKDFFVLGCHFEKLENNKNVLLVKEFINKRFSNENFILGQCLMSDEIDSLSNHSYLISMELSQIQKKLVHQHNDRNVLIYNFDKKDDWSSNAKIYIRGENDLLQDHVTGVHISGLILVESARQMLISTIMFDGYTDDRFVLNNISSSFLSYVFPTEIDISLNYGVNIKNKNEKQVIAKVKISQNGRTCSLFEITATLIPERLAEMSEIMAANQYIISQ